MVFPVPLAAPHVAPTPAATQDQVTPVIEAGTVSATTAFVAVDGPALETTIVYVMGEPGTALSAPSVLVMDKSTVGVTLSMSQAWVGPGVGSVTPTGKTAAAVLVNVPVPAGVPGFRVPVMVNVAMAALGSVTVVAMAFPEPEGAAQLAPTETVAHVHVTPVSAAGTVSFTAPLVTVEGPLFDTETVYVTTAPGTALVSPSDLVMTRSAVATTLLVSVAELFVVTGSVVPLGELTVAVFTRVFVPEGVVGFSVPATVKVTVVPVAKVTV